VAAQDLLALILAAEGVLIIGLMAFNAYFLTQRPIVHYLREIYFINGSRFRQAWYLVISATTFFFLIHVTVLLGQLGVAISPDRAQNAATVFTLAFGTLIILAFARVFVVFMKYVRKLPASREDVHDLILEDMRKSLLTDDSDVRIEADYRRVGDVLSERRQLGPHVSLSHYRALTTGFTGYMEQRWGHMGDAILYAVGRLAGKHAAAQIQRETPDTEAALHQILNEIRENGIGVPEVRQSMPDRVDIVVHESAPAAGSRPMSRPLCHYQAGLFAGVYEVLTGKPALAKETRCWGLGDRYCEFRVDLQAQPKT
jgi:uncharacterized protein